MIVNRWGTQRQSATHGIQTREAMKQRMVSGTGGGDVRVVRAGLMISRQPDQSWQNYMQESVQNGPLRWWNMSLNRRCACSQKYKKADLLRAVINATILEHTSTRHQALAPQAMPSRINVDEPMSVHAQA